MVNLLSGTNVSEKIKAGCPLNEANGQKCREIRELGGSDCLLTCRIIADELDMSRELLRKCQYRILA
jgi:hypothetical protein